jgi:SAM-dependent methyltransferase
MKQSFAASIRQLLPSWAKPGAKVTLRFVQRLLQTPVNWIAKLIWCPIRRRRHAGKAHRQLEIGPGQAPIEGFESLNVNWRPDVDYVADAAGRMPFNTATFELVYASHILEHIPWYKTSAALREWARIIKPGGHIELWVPDGLKIAKAFVDAECSGSADYHKDGWYKFNPEEDACTWANGRFFSYGDGTGRKDNPNWHLALFSPRYLSKLLESAGFIDVEPLKSADVRGYDHGWINLGIKGRKA